METDANDEKGFGILYSDFDENEIVDLFEEDFKNLPENLIVILEKYYQLFNTSDSCKYKLCKEMLEEVEKIGYTLDYGLDGEPYDLRLLTN
jgi:hypothetical protein